ncbi:family finger-like domain protein [Hartmannibacter diazotrophicus]|uniref:Family finger-like domain protein n=1 Tax=Hartmannibacter diazotrophicus TaxID=1482074 RepID=A0A2C9DC48_9HYPH|nr:DUF3426 domain-containing protein [Hartmannibacter diazotrophicus]SON57912.1 family finger-like domain protein [Hartmannibacter diazotrophicus]
MKIICPNCATSYALPDGAIGSAGRNVRCKKCQTVWLAKPPEDLEDAPAAVAASGAAADTYLAAKAAASARAEADGASWAGDGMAGETGSGDFDGSGEEDSDEQSASDEEESDSETDAADEAQSGAGESDLDAALGTGPTIDADPPGFEAADRPAIRPRGKKAKKRPLASDKKHRKRWGALAEVASALIALSGIAIFVGVAIGFRTPIVRAVPDLAGLYAMAGLDINLRGLAIEDVKSYGSQDDAGPLLVVQGAIANVKDVATQVPMLRVSLRNASDREIYAWSVLPPKDVLAPGERIRFESSLPAPPDSATDVVVRFSDRRKMSTRNR